MNCESCLRAPASPGVQVSRRPSGPVRLGWQQSQRVERDGFGCGRRHGCADTLGFSDRRRRIAQRAHRAPERREHLERFARLGLDLPGLDQQVIVAALRRDARVVQRGFHGRVDRALGGTVATAPEYGAGVGGGREFRQQARRQRRDRCAARCRAWRGRRQALPGCGTATSARRHPAAGCRGCLHRRHRWQAWVGPLRWQPTSARLSARRRSSRNQTMTGRAALLTSGRLDSVRTALAYRPSCAGR